MSLDRNAYPAASFLKPGTEIRVQIRGGSGDWPYHATFMTADTMGILVGAKLETPPAIRSANEPASILSFIPWTSVVAIDMDGPDL